MLTHLLRIRGFPSALLVVGLGITHFATAVVAQDSFRIGVNENVPARGPAKGNSEQLIETHRHLGLNSMRSVVPWQQIERQKGQYAVDAHLSAMDNYLLQARSKGIEPLLFLGYGNALYDGGGFPKSAEAQDAFVRYASFLANRYKGAVKYYELWNEYDIGVAIPGHPRGDAESYTSLLKKIYPALKAVDPGIVVLAGATSGVDLGFVVGMLKAGALTSMDAVSVHPYVYPSSPEKALPPIDKLQTEIRRYSGGRDIPVYATEIGWMNFKGPKGSDEELVANYLARVFLLFPTRAFMKGVWWFDRIDDGADPDQGGHHMGLYRHDHSEKPAICALQQMSKMLDEYKPVSVQQQGRQIWVAKFSSTQGFLFAVWSETPDAQPKVKIEAAHSAAMTARGVCRDVSVTGDGTGSINTVITGAPLLLTTSADSITVKQ